MLYLFIAFLIGVVTPAISDSAVARSPRGAAHTVHQKLPPSLVSIVSRYTGSKSLKMQVEKRVKLALLGKEVVHKGELSLASGKLRLEFSEPEKSLIVVDAKNIWVVSFPSKELGGPIQVGLSQRHSTKHPPLLLHLLTHRGFEHDFDLVDQKTSGAVTTFKLAPKHKTADLNRLVLQVDLKNKTISSLTYWDDLENETSFIFGATVWNPQLSPQLFQYNPPLGAKVTRY